MPFQSETVVELLEGSTVFADLADEWSLLVGQSPISIYSTPAWYSAWSDAYNRNRISVFTARRGGRLMGVLPIARIRTDLRGLYFTRLAPLAGGDYQPLIVRPESAAEVIPPLLDAAFRRLGRYGVFWWPHLPAAHPTHDVLLAYLSSRKMPYAEEREVAPRANLEGLDFSAAEQIWTAHHRKDVRRQRKRLSERGPVELWQPSTLAEAETVLQEFFLVHDQKWFMQGYPGKFQDPRVRRLFMNLTRQFWNNGLHFSTVRCGDVHVSYHFGFLSGGWLHWYRPTYRTEYAVHSPTKIHIAMVIEQICRNGWNGLDFLLGDEPYKLQWTNEQVEVVNIHAAFRHLSPSYAWFAKGKPYVRTRLQQRYFNVKSWLQQQRRRLSGASES